MCKSVGLLSIETAALAVVHGHPSKLDVMKVTSVDAENNPPTYCVLQISYGIISDVDFDSEKYRAETGTMLTYLGFGFWVTFVFRCTASTAFYFQDITRPS